MKPGQDPTGLEMYCYTLLTEELRRRPNSLYAFTNEELLQEMQRRGQVAFDVASLTTEALYAELQSRGATEDPPSFNPVKENVLAACTSAKLYQTLLHREDRHSLLALWSPEELLAHLTNIGRLVSPITEYQQACSQTESEVTGDALQRWDRSWRIGLQLLSRMNVCSIDTALDNLKKYAAYGKIPDDLRIHGNTTGSVESRPPYTFALPSPENQIQCYRLLHGMLGIHTEVEELTAAVLEGCSNPTRSSSHFISFDTVNIAEEIGDLLWYMVLVCNALGLSLAQIMQTNIEKLQLRYRTKIKEKGQAIADELGMKENQFAPGIFTETAAINRDLPAERQLLEQSQATPETDYSKLHKDRAGNLRTEDGKIVDPFAVPETEPAMAELLIEPIDTDELLDETNPPKCPHPSIKTGRTGQRVCAVCNEALSPDTKPKAFGF